MEVVREDGAEASGSSGGPGGERCQRTLQPYIFDEKNTDMLMWAGPKPAPEAEAFYVFCGTTMVGMTWVLPAEPVDVAAVAWAEAQRYVDEVLVPAVSIGFNPVGRGLVGFASWFWVEGFTGTVTAPPISALGATVEVRMSSRSVTWDFGDGTAPTAGDLGRAYPAESSVRHVFEWDGTYTVRAVIDLVPEYRVDGGPWLTLPDLTATASVDHAVDQRQAVITHVGT